LPFATVQPPTRRHILAAHPAPCPEELAERAIKLLTYRRDLVVDPFNGSGTLTAVAKRFSRRFIGIDRSPNYCAFAQNRLLALDGAANHEAEPISCLADLPSAAA
jgi:DNA modification methylase